MTPNDNEIKAQLRYLAISDPGMRACLITALAAALICTGIRYLGLDLYPNAAGDPWFDRVFLVCFWWCLSFVAAAGVLPALRHLAESNYVPPSRFFPAALLLAALVLSFGRFDWFPESWRIVPTLLWPFFYCFLVISAMAHRAYGLRKLAPETLAAHRLSAAKRLRVDRVLRTVLLVLMMLLALTPALRLGGVALDRYWDAATEILPLALLLLLLVQFPDQLGNRLLDLSPDAAELERNSAASFRRCRAWGWAFALFSLLAAVWACVPISGCAADWVAVALDYLQYVCGLWLLIRLGDSLSAWLNAVIPLPVAIAAADRP